MNQTSPGPRVELSELVPESILRTSKTLGWRGLNADLRRLTPGGMGAPPGNSEHLLALQVHTRAVVTQTFDGRTNQTLLLPGDLTFLPAGTPWWWGWQSAHEAMDVRLDPAFLGAVAERCQLNPRRLELAPVFQFRDPWLACVLEGVRAELLRQDAAGPVYIESVATAVAVHLLRRFAGPARQPPSRRQRGLDETTLRRLLRFIEDRLAERLDVIDLADAVQLSPFHFARQFKASVGHSPHEYILRRRVESARQLLIDRPDLTLAEIAQRCGFCDQSHLTRHFRRFVGCTPTRYRG